MTGQLVHTGQVVIDLVMRVDSLPERGGDVLASATELLAGGGFNVMAAAARSGSAVRYAGAHGAGRFGEQAREALRREGITLTHPPIPGVDTGVCVVFVDADGERTFVTGPGAEMALTKEQLASVEVTAEDIVYVSGYSLLHEEKRAALLDWLPTVSAAWTLFDPGPLAAEIPAEVLSRVLSTVNMLSCNAREATKLTGLADTSTAANTLRGRLAEPAVVIVRDGPAGCVLAGPEGTETVEGFPVTPVDTNGAGDTHCGVLAASLLAGFDLRSAARRANAAAALSVQRHGPATAPTAAELDAFLAAHPG